jgi:hypothetical protein
MGVLGVKAAALSCAGTAGIACVPAAALGAWGVNEAVDGASWFRAKDVDGINPAKEALKAASVLATGNADAGETTYNGVSLVMNVWSAKTATQLWLTTPKLGGGWLTTGYAWQSMSSIDRSWLLYDSSRTLGEMAPKK